MNRFNNITGVADKIKDILNSSKTKNKLALLYAFNSTGKTRLSTEFSKLNDDTNKHRVLCYNAFVEDIFKWDNEKYVLNFDKDSWIIEIIEDQGIVNDIIDKFHEITNSNIEPSFDFTNDEISFNIVLSGNDNKKNIKISKGEESLFIWSIFHAILEVAVDALSESEDDRTTDIFNKLEYIIIDDPVSSIDDAKIIAMAVQLIETINKAKINTLKVLVTTHHALFYNVLYSKFNRNKTIELYPYSLSKNDKKLEFKEHKSESPFGYHLMIKDEIKQAIDSNDIKKYHFNLFRTILEKTANFLGYGHWVKCLPKNQSVDFLKMVDSYSHDRISEFESRDLPNEHQKIFIETFNQFIKEYNWK